MKLVIQRVKEAKVEVEGKIVGKIEKAFWFCWEYQKKTRKKMQII